MYDDGYAVPCAPGERKACDYPEVRCRIDGSGDSARIVGNPEATFYPNYQSASLRSGSDGGQQVHRWGMGRRRIK